MCQSRDASDEWKRRRIREIGTPFLVVLQGKMKKLRQRFLNPFHQFPAGMEN